MRNAPWRACDCRARPGSQLYAVPAVLGSAFIAVVEYLHLYGSLAAGLAAVFVFVVRVGALGPVNVGEWALRLFFSLIQQRRLELVLPFLTQLPVVHR